MKKTYLNLEDPNNNIIYDYDFKGPANGTIAWLKKLRATELYRLIPLAFTKDSSWSKKPYASTAREIVSKMLEDERNYPYVGYRCKYPDNYPTSYPTHRNNVLHGIISMNPLIRSTEELSFIKKIFTIAISEGVDPQEKSMSKGYTPLALFLIDNSCKIDSQLDFLEFLIALDPQSLTNFSMDRKPIFDLVLDYKIEDQEDTDLPRLVELIAQHLPEKALGENLTHLDNTLNNYDDPVMRKRFEPVRQILIARQEKSQLEKGIINTPMPIKDIENLNIHKKTFKV